MSEDDTNKLSSMGKRRFLKTLSAIGVSSSALAHLSKEALAQATDDPKREVPLLKCLHHTNHDAVEKGAKPVRKAEYFTLPRDEWARMKAAENVSLRVTEYLNSNSNLPELAVGVVADNGGGGTNRTIVVEYPEDSRIYEGVAIEDVRESLPDSIDGFAGEGKYREVVEDIPIEVEEVPIGRLEYFEHSYRPVPGGCSFTHDGGSGGGTLATPAYSSNGNVLVTAGHCTNGAGTNIHQPFDQLFTDEHIGSVVQSIGENYSDSDVEKFDAATIGIDTEDDVIYRIANWDANTYLRRHIGGIWSWDAISAWKGTSTQVTLQGTTTGRSSGKVTKLYPSSKNYAISASSAGGDSGGPHYRRRCDTCDDLLISGVHNGSNLYGAVGTAMEEVENQFNVIV